MSEPLLAARGVFKSYRLARREIPVLRNISLEARHGDFLALRGSSGAGKSTLLHLLGALDAPDRGSIRLNGEEVATGSPAVLSRIRNRSVGFVFQAYHLLPELDALENVALPARVARREASEVEAKARELLRRVGLAERVEHRPYELSGGEQQRVAIARALMNDPALLLADEPTGNLDSRTGHEIIDLLLELQAERQMTLIMATHAAEIASRAPRVLELVDGALSSIL
ncbi:MAG: ABC transporter ATP-binding protein [Verrucomicrobia bacterium]|nr:ABC transporter ATP-binding protein [Verrucomicrobiota bacterium]MBI3870575.1 ABC transporter ATP-binding protein [Verrucomicrobiota bacterium]